MQETWSKAQNLQPRGMYKQCQKGRGCLKHGAEVKRCSHEGCANYAQKGGVCVRHGEKRTHKDCSHEGCSNIVEEPA